MSVVSICSAKGSPGVTTLACALGAVWPARRSVVVAECDPSGGDLAGRFGLETQSGMTSLVLSQRHRTAQETGYATHRQHLPGGLDVLVGPVGADAAMAVDRELGAFTVSLASPGWDVIADCGRLLPGAVGQESVIRSSETVVLLVKPDASGVAHARWALTRIAELHAGALVVLTRQEGPYGPDEVADALGVAVTGVVPTDVPAASIAAGAPGPAKSLARSALVASARRIATAIAENGRATVAVGADEPTEPRTGPRRDRPSAESAPPSRRPQPAAQRYDSTAATGAVSHGG